MSTTQQLLALVDAIYPNGEATATKILFMNQAQAELSPYFGTVVEDNTLSTVANQDSYSLPTGLSDVSQIMSLGVGTKATPDNRYDYVKYDIITRDDYPQGSCVYFQTVSSTGVKKIVLQPTPSTSGFPIRIRYRKALTDLSATSLTSSPDFDSRFHYLLAYYTAHMICSIGASPDVIQANAFMQKWESGLNELWKLKMQEEVIAPTFRKDNRHWRTGRTHAGN